MTIGIVEDHELYLEGIKLLLLQQGHHICFAANSGKALLELLPVNTPQILLCDVNLPDTDPEDLLTAIRQLYPALPVVYLTLMRGSRYLKKLLRQDIQGYVLKNAPVAELELALQTVLAGGKYFSKDVGLLTESDEYRNTVTVEARQIGRILTEREMEILQLICREMSNQQIAQKLFLSVGTVDTHRKNIIQKLGVNNTVGLVRYALKTGLIN
ncbi:MAG: response regulator transcription factor [Chitinophagaceae bacterium]|jgi:DNA-binding NarL/FixJ family response regulator|nr:response regulator transcription factor [Chitinophagaceae bacterium]